MTSAGTLRMWLSPDFFNWNTYVQVHPNDADWERAYSIWMHSERILEQHSDEFHLVDAITTLKRAMSHRLQLLQDIYRLDTIPIAGMPKRTIDQLAFVGVVRPSMLRQLLEIRNAVEHADARPPDLERCQEMLDFVWYFLRSTDRLAIYQPIEIEFESEAYTIGVDNTYEMKLIMGPQNGWTPDFAAWINSSQLVDHDPGGWLAVELTRNETRDEVRSQIHRDLEAHKHRLTDDVRIEGVFVKSAHEMRALIDLYFRLAPIGL